MYVTLPNFAAIGQTVAEIWRFIFFFQWSHDSMLWIYEKTRP